MTTLREVARRLADEIMGGLLSKQTSVDEIESAIIAGMRAALAEPSNEMMEAPQQADLKIWPVDDEGPTFVSMSESRLVWNAMAAKRLEELK